MENIITSSCPRCYGTLEEETFFNIDKLFDLQTLEKFEKNEDKDYSLSELLTGPFNWYFFPNNILTEEPYEDRSHLSLDKFKEKNIRNVKEDMMYYCTPVDILAKLDGQNSGYAAIESQNEFVEDLGIVSFLQNEKIIEKNIKDEFQVEKISGFGKLFLEVAYVFECCAGFAVASRFLAISQYSSEISKPMYSLPVSFAIFAVVPLPVNGSSTTSPGFDHEMMWSLASASGKIAGCL